MKIRNGFVSNSSSSSFCVVGVSYELAAKLLSAEMKLDAPVRPNHGDDCECSKCRDFERRSQGGVGEELSHLFNYGKFAPEDPKKKMILEYYGGYSVEAAGLPAEELLKTHTVPEAAKYLQNLIKKKLGVEVPLGEIGLKYGEAGNG